MSFAATLHRMRQQLHYKTHVSSGVAVRHRQVQRTRHKTKYEGKHLRVCHSRLVVVVR